MMFKNPSEFATNIALVLLAGLAIANGMVPNFFIFASFASLLIVFTLGYLLYFRIPQAAKNLDAVTVEAASDNNIEKIYKSDQIVVVIPSSENAVISYDIMINVRHVLESNRISKKEPSKLWDDFVRLTDDMESKYFSETFDYLARDELGGSPKIRLPRNIQQFQEL